MLQTQQLAILEKTKAEGVLDTLATASESTTKKQDTNTKNHSMLTAFVNASLRGLNRFQAYRQHHDSVLNSTISVLQRKYCLNFSRERETVPNFKGGKTSVMRYWLDEANRAKAIAIIAES
jgi:hypothetical protein